jgi:peptide/nickel transport system substrate-binding protein
VRTSKDDGEPVRGGTLVYGLDADTANGWAPYRSSLAGSGNLVISLVTDSLFTVTDAGETVPLLVQSVEHNDDYTQWTMHIRDGIKFQDGSPLDGAAVKFNIDSCVYAPLSGPALSTIDHVEASGQDVTVFTKGGPWVVFPDYFVGAGCGYMMSAEWLATLSDVPQRNPQSPAYDAALAATPASGDPAKPVGLGPFTFVSYTPGNGNAFKAVRNDDYWRGPKGITGEDLPYLDEVDAVVSVDEESRSNSVRAGDFDLMLTANADTINRFLDDSSFKLDSSTHYAATAYILLNVAQGDLDPNGANAKSPLLNIDCRKALAYGIDRDRVAKERGAGLAPVANGPFPPGSVGYLQDTGYPGYDPDTAKAEMATCLKALGTDHIEFSFNTTNDPYNVETNTLIASMWTDLFGDQVRTSITAFEQGQYIGLALTGAFNAIGAINHAGYDPDQQRLWWQSTSALPIGTLALNFGRFRDADMDKALDTIKSNPDPAARRAAAEEVNRIFGKQVYNLFFTWVLGGIISRPYVNGVQRNILPDGTKGVGLSAAVRHSVTEMWCTNGKCE